jgi:hypothetical protein
MVMHFGQEEILFTALDFGAKLIFTLSVLLINFTVFDNAVEARLELVQEYLAREIHRKKEVRAVRVEYMGLKRTMGQDESTDSLGFPALVGFPWVSRARSTRAPRALQRRRVEGDYIERIAPCTRFTNS